MFRDAGQGGVGKASDIVYLEHLEYVVHAYYKFQIGIFAHDVGAFGKLVQLCVGSILWQQRVVLVGKMSPHTLERNVFAPFQPSYKRKTVEYLALQVPRKVKLCIAVVKEFHVLHKVERTLMLEERGVDGGIISR